ncbi:hypothetical protein [Streptomyces sp. NRRL B-24720]|uniref:hypothetical protein n=1 Tax=Streptomyces sp. NRRL B-24720 TaxID=1476876 RepID=UPI0004C6E1F2|nr:hypothetical protein [Streptomyces sp. NRRL B-24720]
MTAIPPKYEFTATNAQEIYALLEAAEKLLDAHLAMLDPGGRELRIDLRKATPARMTLTLDLGPILQKITEVAELNEQIKAPSADHTDR